MSHTSKIWERGIEHCLKGIMSISLNQFGFMSERTTIEAVFLRRQVVQEYREQNKDLHIISIDLEKDYSKIPRNDM
jgi:hypothetical protein